MPQCPTCQSDAVIRTAPFIQVSRNSPVSDAIGSLLKNSEQKLILEQTRTTTDKEHLIRVSLTGIVRVTGVSLRWLQYYVNKKYGL